MIKIDCCVCYSISFEELHQISKQYELKTFEDLKNKKLCGARCQMCVPYIKKMLETGQTEFENQLE